MSKPVPVHAPSLGESESEATLVRLLKQPGEPVAEGETIAEIESDKITMELPAPTSGVLLRWAKKEGEQVRPGELLAEIEEKAVEQPSPAPQKRPAEEEPSTASAAAKPSKVPAPEDSGAASFRKETVQASRAVPAAAAPAGGGGRRVAMTPIRKRIAERLKQAQQTAAMLTTFNEADMSAVMRLRKRWGKAFFERHGVKLGITSFFVHAVCRALAQYPVLNARIEGDAIVYHDHVHCGVAVATEEGLIVPVIRNAHAMTLAEIERAIDDLAQRARTRRLRPEDLSGGTFSITNGGIFGSLLSTPILNPPQSAILGLHAIKERPVAVDGRIEIRPMMYLALTYDHRLIDGEQAVRFLVTVKDWIENAGLSLLDL